MHILKIQIEKSTDANDRIETAILLSYIYVGAVNTKHT
jgi:hypothetical protein